MRLFTLAVQHNFVQGRKTENVCSACLYIVCRREKTPHLLIDFSDLLQTNVFPLGQVRFSVTFSVILALLVGLSCPAFWAGIPKIFVKKWVRHS